MHQLDDFIGTWRASPGAPYSSHTFTWRVSEEGLQGVWVIEASDSPIAGRMSLNSGWRDQTRPWSVRRSTSCRPSSAVRSFTARSKGIGSA